MMAFKMAVITKMAAIALRSQKMAQKLKYHFLDRVASAAGPFYSWLAKGKGNSACSANFAFEFLERILGCESSHH